MDSSRGDTADAVPIATSGVGRLEPSIDDRYLNGEYLRANPDWGAQDGPWKAAQINGMVRDHHLAPRSICDIGCGSGAVLAALRSDLPDSTELTGFELSPQAYALALRNEGITFINASPADSELHFDLALVLDVFEHVENYFEFLRTMRHAAELFIFHVPLDMTVSAVLRLAPIIQGRASLGHLHYFCRETALLTIKESGYTIIDDRYTDAGLSSPNRGRRTALLYWPRWIGRRISPHLTVRVLGGFSLLVLARPTQHPAQPGT